MKTQLNGKGGGSELGFGYTKFPPKSPVPLSHCLVSYVPYTLQLSYVALRLGDGSSRILSKPPMQRDC